MVFNGVSWKNYNANNSGLVDNSIRCFAFSASGDTWIGTENNGLVKFDGNNNWVTYNTANSKLPNNKIWKIAIESNQQKIWIGTLGGGLALLNLNPNSISPLSEKANKLSFAPNPFYKKTTVIAENKLQNATMNIYTTFGQLVKQINNIYGESFTFESDNLPIGWYTASILQGNKEISRSKFIISE
jgi:hypothetical protein